MLPPVLVALAYYVGARVGFLFQTAAVPQSVLWLPNSILLAALMMSRPRRWPIILVASIPAQLLVSWQSHAPLGTMSLLFVTNACDAMLGASLWRVVTRCTPPPQGLRLMLSYILVVATLPTLLLSFADAAITVATHWGNDYWLAYSTRARANVLTNVILVPVPLAFAGKSRVEALAVVRARWLEAALLLAGLIATASFALSRPDASPSMGALAYYLPLPLLLWSAVRFGVGMTGASMLVLAYVTTWFATHGVMGRAAPPSDASALVLQFQLLAVAVPMLCLAAVVQERQAAARALAENRLALDQSLIQVRDLAGRLLTAEEAERTRIARELHDDVSQQLAALSIALSSLKRQLPDSAPLRANVVGVQRQAMMIADDVRALSHELHPAVLRYAGLVPALRELCIQFCRRATVRVELVEGEEVHATPDVALCLYRVTQEALRNAIRHAGAQIVQVRLASRGDAIDLDVADDGRGFDTELPHGGLGLISIDERVRLVNGVVRLDTAPGQGTRLSVRIPPGGINAPDHGSPR